MKNLIYLFSALIICLLSTQCKPVDIYDRFPAEILYKHYVQTQTGMQWILSPDAKEHTLASETELFLEARVSAPNGLKTVTVYEVTGGTEKEVIKYEASEFAFEGSPNVFWFKYTFTGITSTKVIRITAVCNKKMKTSRDFTIKK